MYEWRLSVNHDIPLAIDCESHQAVILPDYIVRFDKKSSSQGITDCCVFDNQQLRK